MVIIRAITQFQIEAIYKQGICKEKEQLGIILKRKKNDKKERKGLLEREYKICSHITIYMVYSVIWGRNSI